jgi:hypothetical protein
MRVEIQVQIIVSKLRTLGKGLRLSKGLNNLQTFQKGFPIKSNQVQPRDCGLI